MLLFEMVLEALGEPLDEPELLLQLSEVHHPGIRGDMLAVELPGDFPAGEVLEIDLLICTPCVHGPIGSGVS